MGINAIELMPVCEFDGNLNWGYSPNHYFALDKTYGSPEQFKTFVDSCHALGIAVILDMVFNHATGLNPMNKLYPYGDDLKYNPWFNVKAPHGDNVYEDWNHDFEPAHQMFIRALQYWLTEYKVDGFRLDLSHGLCGSVGGTSVRNIKDYYEKGVKAVSSDAYMILEHWGDNCEADRRELIAAGMLCWDNTSEAYYTSAKGSTSSSFMNANRDGYVTYCESHDEERSFFHAKQFGTGNLKTDDRARIARVPLNMAFLTLLNGPQMFYHFAEFGYDYSKWQSKDGKWGKDDEGKAPYGMSGVDNYNYKMEVKKRPESWLGEDSWRTQAFHKVGQAIQLRTRLMPEVFEGNPTRVDIGGGKIVRTIQWGSNVFVAGNFSVSEEQIVKIPDGIWYNYYEQTEQKETIVTLAPGALLILTGTPQVLPEMCASYMFDSAIEDIYVPETTIGIYPPYNVTIYTVSGQAVSYQRNVEQVNMNGLNNGLYLIQFEKKGQRVTKKVIR
jgi:glycosidase